MNLLRLKTYSLYALALFVGLIIIGLIYYRDDIFQSLLDPGKPFQTYDPPKAPNYNDDYYWLERPDLTVSRDDLPEGGDIFVIAPELFKGGDDWNMPVDHEKLRRRLASVIQPNYVAPFRESGRVFAPYYRQAAMYTFMTNREDARRALDFAYQDVKRAFEVFMRSSLPERPIVIVGYGQGGSHAERLLADYFQGPLSGQLAVAYIIDYPLPVAFFDTQYLALSPCLSATDTNCIVSWGAFMPRDDAIAARFVSRLKIYNGHQYETVDNRPLLCTNPLLWNLSEDYAPARLHKGGVAAIDMQPGDHPVPLAKQVGVQCQDGILYVDQPKSRSLRRPIRIGGKYRTLPSNLFYEDLRENATARIKALIDSGNIPKRAPKLEDKEVLEIVDSPITPVKND